MLSLLLLSLVASAKYEFAKVKYGQLLVAEGLNDKDLQKAYKELKKNVETYCSYSELKSLEDSDDKYSDPQYFVDLCIATVKNMNQVKATSSADMNKALKKFNKANEFLIILGSFGATDIDLSNIKHEMIVSLSYEDDVSIFDAKQLEEDKYIELLMKRVKVLMKSRLDGSEEGYRRYALAEKKPRRDDDDYYIFSLIGDVGKKVSYLICISSCVKISKSPLNAPRVFFYDCPLEPSSENIKSTHFVQDYTSMLYNNRYMSKFEVEQFGLYLGSYLSSADFRIRYKQEGWVIETKGYLNILYDINGNEFLVPYKSASKLNFIVFTNELNILLPSGVDIKTFSPLNLTLVKEVSYTPFKLETKKIKITQEGFDSIAKESRPKVTLSYDKTKFEYTKSDDDEFVIEEEPVYSYKPLNRKNTNVGMIVGIVVAVVVVIAIVVVVVIIVLRKKKNADNSASEGQGSA